MEKKNKKVKYKTDEQQEMIKFLIIILVIVVCVVGIYFLTRAFVTKDLKKEKAKETDTAGSVKSDVTIVGTILNRPYEEYYVLVYDKSATSAGKYDAIYTKFTQKQEEAEHELEEPENPKEKDKNKNKNKDKDKNRRPSKIFYIDLSNKLNEDYVKGEDEESNPEAKTVSELKFGEITLIRIEHGEIIKYIEDEDAIKEELDVKDDDKNEEVK